MSDKRDRREPNEAKILALCMSVFDYTTQRFLAPVKIRSSKNQGASITKLLFFFSSFFYLSYAMIKINDKTDLAIRSVEQFLSLVISFPCVKRLQDTSLSLCARVLFVFN